MKRFMQRWRNEILHENDHEFMGGLDNTHKDKDIKDLFDISSEIFFANQFPSFDKTRNDNHEFTNKFHKSTLCNKDLKKMPPNKEEISASSIVKITSIESNKDKIILKKNESAPTEINEEMKSSWSDSFALNSNEIWYKSIQNTIEKLYGKDLARLYSSK